MITIAPLTLGPAAVGGLFSATITASGETAPYSYIVSAGTLPAGLTMDTAGNIAGTPTTPGTSVFTVTATDSATIPVHGVRDYTFVVDQITISPSALPSIPTGSPYSVTLTPQGGAAPYTMVLSAGAVPTGMTFDPATGVLGGTPAATGTTAFTITATDATGATGQQTYTAVVKPPVYWYICSRAEDIPSIPQVAANQADHNRKVAAAIDRITRSPYQVGHMIARPVVMTIPGHMLCDGKEVSRTAFPQLFAEIGTTWGEGDGSTTFNLPDMIGAPLTVPVTAPAETVDNASVSSATSTVTSPSTPSETGGTSGGSVDSGGVPAKDSLALGSGAGATP